MVVLTFILALTITVGILSAVNALLAPLAEIIADDVVTLITKQEHTPPVTSCGCALGDN